MKKLLMLAVALSLSAVPVSCKKEIGKLGNTVLNAGKNEADAVIGFNNDFLDSYKRTSDHVESILKYSDAAVTKAKGGDVLIMPMVTGSLDYAIGKIKEVPSGFDKNKAAIEKDFQTYKAKKESIDKKFEELKSYMNAEDFKDDKGAKAETLNKEIQADAQVLFEAGERIVTNIKPATDAAEETILKDHPMKEYIISSKKVMNALDNAYDTLNKQHDSSFNAAEAQKRYDELAAAVAQNSKLDFKVKGTQYTYKKTDFESINRNAESFLDTYRRLIRNAKDSGKISDSDIRSIGYAYDAVLNSYNIFVK
ncbi:MULTISPECIES: DUF3829 domain-containing protein [Chryseobacterium]|uniref:DUF3829 domain-containing protein n=1 Tax=Chryseobacterium camelliae TaxID=1265445 RepID=A0ABU0TGZ8_9FLAO|nr:MULTISPECIES: DUF3829 domain-containing protein [Chryseobacterium]MDT3405872.1 hypothetical protein [Pseudacidovorax intermedius]MDQ1096323.1 hypothetical protein [Chryseobacterium camelliae]MDQ1100262.1 hypothetical protein [Chryseobacterium sp. SORGH_AS_1048]MDR6087605.1 hypothetical protein [Chryseobacterium sp. SORGH_AS_0909]MDR6131979.1 hypothetical protein [Chryseobacterium sp. SORGH_AS_1175]